MTTPAPIRAANGWRMAPAATFAHRREMAKSFGYVEPYSRGRFCVRFQVEGRVHRITSLETPLGKRIAIRDRATAVEILEEIRATIRQTGDPLAAVAPYMRRSKLLGLETRWNDFCEVQTARVAAGQLSRKRAEELAGHLSRGKLDVIRDIPILAVDFAALEALQLDLFDRGLAPKSVHHVLADVRTFLRWCARRRLIQAVPEIPLTQLEEYEPTIPSAAEQRARIEGIPAEARGYFIARGLLGIRHGEALRLELAHYRRGPWDEDKRRWTDELSIRGKGRRFRVLPAPADLADWVREHRPALAEAGAPLFVNPKSGDAWSMSSLMRVWRAMEKRLELPHVKPNESLRHCFGTRTAERLILGGMSRDQAQAAVMSIMGHTSRATSDRYVKLAAETMRETIE